MAGYLEWVAITALVVAVAALAVGLAEMRKRRQRQAAVRYLHEAMQGYSAGRSNQFQEKWEREIKKYESSQKDADQSTQAP